MVVEVADSSLVRDRTLKKRLYAQAGIAVYWIVNLAEGRLEVYSRPESSPDHGDYADRQDYVLSQEVPLVIETRTVAMLAVAALWPAGK